MAPDALNLNTFVFHQQKKKKTGHSMSTPQKTPSYQVVLSVVVSLKSDFLPTGGNICQFSEIISTGFQCKLTYFLKS